MTTAAPPRLESLPAELQVGRFVCSRKKVPYIPGTDRKASSTDPATWRSFHEALSAYHRGGYDGLYYACTLESGIVAIDLDHCIPAGVVDPWAMVNVRLLNSYTEVSPSGEGLRIFVKANKTSDRCKKGPVECYARERFMSVTGHHLADTPETIEERQAELEAFERLAFGEPKPALAPSNGQHAAGAGLDHEDITSRILLSQKGRKLHAGDTSDYSSASEADLAYLNIARIAGADREQAKRLILASGLARDKLNRPDYLERTLDKAMAADLGDWPEHTVSVGSGLTNGKCSPHCEKHLERIRALEAEVGELRTQRTRLAQVMSNKGLKGNPKLVAIVATFEAQSAESRKPGAWHPMYRETLAEKTGLSPQTVGDALKLLSTEDGILERRESWQNMSPTTGEIFEPPRRIVEYRPREPSVSATLEKLAAFAPPPAEGRKTWGGRRDPRCPLHPRAGSIVRCRECNKALANAAAPLTGEDFPWSQVDSMGEDAPQTVDTGTQKSHLDSIGQPITPDRGQDDICLDCGGSSPRGLTPCDACLGAGASK